MIRPFSPGSILQEEGKSGGGEGGVVRAAGWNGDAGSREENRSGSKAAFLHPSTWLTDDPKVPHSRGPRSPRTGDAAPDPKVGSRTDTPQSPRPRRICIGSRGILMLLCLMTLHWQSASFKAM
jgi:hypothetical protein